MVYTKQFAKEKETVIAALFVYYDDKPDQTSLHVLDGDSGTILGVESKRFEKEFSKLLNSATRIISNTGYDVPKPEWENIVLRKGNYFLFGKGYKVK